jgi:hypothetical protein
MALCRRVAVQCRAKNAGYHSEARGAETVRCRFLSLRHLLWVEVSLRPSRASKIASIRAGSSESSRLAPPALNVKLVSPRPYSPNLRTAGKRYGDLVG